MPATVPIAVVAYCIIAGDGADRGGGALYNLLGAAHRGVAGSPAAARRGARRRT